MAYLVGLMCSFTVIDILIFATRFLYLSIALQSSNMKRAMPWSDEEEDSSEESSSHSDNESDDGVGKTKEKNKSRSEQSSKGTNLMLALPFI